MFTLRQFKTALISSILSLVLGQAVVHADDTEIFFGQSDDVLNTNPNILFILDTSGSMARTDNTSESRMARMKTAMNLLLDQSSSFNVGLMGFSGKYHGGSIRYPVGDLESDSGSLCEGGMCPDETVIARPASGADDATQNDDTGVVTLDANSLSMSSIVGLEDDEIVFSESDQISGTATASAVAAEYDNGSDQVSRSITGINRWFYSGTPDTEEDLYAYRFDSVDIPKGATIIDARLVFTKTSEQAQTGSMSAYVSLEATPTAEPLPNGANTVDSINKRLDPVHRTELVPWIDVPPQIENLITEITKADFTDATPTIDANQVLTPNLNEIVEQVVSLPGWSTGNAMSFLINPFDTYQPGEADIREYYGINVPGNAPKLVYTYSRSVESDLSTTTAIATAHVDEIVHQNTGFIYGNTGNPQSRLFFANDEFEPRKLAFRFDDLDIPANARIVSANLTFTGSLNSEPDSPLSDWNPYEVTNAADSAIDAEPELGSVRGFTPNQIVSAGIKAETTGKPAAYTTTALTSRDLTTEFIPWENIEVEQGKEVLTPNIASVIEAVITTDNWKSGDSLSLVLEASSDYQNVFDNSLRLQTSTSRAKPILQITWEEGEDLDTGLSNTQTTGIRFDNVQVPPNATVKSAVIEFQSFETSDIETSLVIRAQNSSMPLPFEATVNNIGSRPTTAESVDWEVEPWLNLNTRYSTPRLDSIVQSIVSSGDWCGGNPMAFTFEGTGDRKAYSTEGSNARQARLVITYEPSSVPPGAFCSNSNYQTGIVDNAGDAVEDKKTSVMDNAGSSLDTINPTTNNEQLIGLRFPGIIVPQNAVILNATLEMTPSKDVTQVQEYEFKIGSDINSNDFFLQKSNISNRPTHSIAVKESIQVGTAPNSIFRTNVTPLVQTRVNSNDWSSGKPITLIVDALSGIDQSFFAFDGDEARVPRLSISYQSERSQPGTLFRENLKEIVNELTPQGHTPIVSSYFEASQYFSGEAVDYGLRRGAQNWDDRYHRVSHPSSYINGEVDRHPECIDSNLNSQFCIQEKITPSAGKTPTYKTPIVSECQQNHIVVLSDGEATSNTAADRIKNFTGVNNCSAGGVEACGVELAHWMQDKNTDLDSVLPGNQQVITHTIGFNLDNPEFLKKLAKAGNGQFYEAESAEDLLNAFQNIFISVSDSVTTFVSPGTTINQANRLKNRDDIYFSLFRPGATARWTGNLKKFKALGTNENDTAEIFDANGNPAIDPNTGTFRTNSQSYWSSSVDGSSVSLGGAAEQIEQNGQSHLNRKVYTYTGHNQNLIEGLYNDLLPENTFIEREWLKLTPTLVADTEYVTNLINWAHGKDINDIDGDGNTDEARGQMGDPLHSEPLVVNYVGGQSVVHVATNEGFLHAIDHLTGEENFAFIPKELLSNINKNFENKPTQSRPYGLDGGLSFWLDDANNDGIVDPTTDRAYLYIAMRRGGNLYYALDITKPDAPRYLWSINGGIDLDDTDPTTANGDFTRLGETWSKPVKARIYRNSEEVDVLIFGGGYDTNQDPLPDSAFASDTLDSTGPTGQIRSADGIGNAIFIVNARSGNLIWQSSENDYPRMTFSIPSTIRVIDINFDGLADQLYFGDMGGQVWRMDINNDPLIERSINQRITGGVVGDFAGDAPDSNRRFYYPPDISLIQVDGEQQLAVSIGSGWRAHPLDTVVKDRFYSFRIRQVFGASLDSQGEVVYPIVRESTTGMVNITGTIGNYIDKEKRGWFLEMDRPGEKILSSSTTADGKLLFTTYLPASQVTGCEGVIGSGNIYIVDAVHGNPVLDLDDQAAGSITDENGLTNSDRRRELGHGGIPTKPSLLFPELAKATILVGTETLDEVPVVNLKNRTFWQEFIDENL